MMGQKGRDLAKKVLEQQLQLPVAVDLASNRLEFRFEQFAARNGLIVEVRKSGLTRHRVKLSFGNFSGDLKKALSEPNEESLKTARALLNEIAKHPDITNDQERSFESWTPDEDFKSVAFQRRGKGDATSDAEVLSTVELIVVPILAAMAELIGYENPSIDRVEKLEGRISEITIKKRERSKSNRLLALKIHGTTCAVCGFNAKQVYGEGVEIIEIHHIQPLASSDEPLAYDPATDLIPLCPNCHRAIHSKKASKPFTPEELRELIRTSIRA